MSRAWSASFSSEGSQKPEGAEPRQAERQRERSAQAQVGTRPSAARRRSIIEISIESRAASARGAGLVPGGRAAGPPRRNPAPPPKHRPRR